MTFVTERNNVTYHSNVNVVLQISDDIEMYMRSKRLPDSFPLNSNEKNMTKT